MPAPRLPASATSGTPAPSSHPTDATLHLDVNRSAELTVFVLVAEHGSFSAAARQSDLSPSAVSKIIARLERRLGVRLLQRSTRQLQLTPEGQRLLDQGKRVLADLNELESELSARSQPKGIVRISASSSTGNQILVPLMPALMAQFPQLTIDLSFTDQVIDLIEARTDIAIRWGKLPASDLLARELGHTRQVIVASPAYLAQHGTPAHPDDLAHHVRMGWNYPRAVPQWPLRVNGERVGVPLGERLRVNDGEVLRQLALAGAGLARLSLYHAWGDLAAQRLRVVLEAFNPGDLEPIHAVYLGKPEQLPPRTRAVLYFLNDHVDLRHAQALPEAWCH